MTTTTTTTMTMPLSPPCHYRRAYKNDGPCPPVSKNPEGTGGGTVMAWGHQKMDQWCHITTRVVYVIGYTKCTQTPKIIAYHREVGPSWRAQGEVQAAAPCSASAAVADMPALVDAC